MPRSNFDDLEEGQTTAMPLCAIYFMAVLCEDNTDSICEAIVLTSFAMRCQATSCK